MCRGSKHSFSVSLESTDALGIWRFFPKSHTLFIGPESTKKCKFCFKTKPHGTIHTFKNYFDIIFLVINVSKQIFRGD